MALNIINRATMPIDPNAEIVLVVIGQRSSKQFVTWERDKNNHACYHGHYFPMHDYQASTTEESEALALLAAVADFQSRCARFHATPEC